MKSENSKIINSSTNIQDILDGGDQFVNSNNSNGYTKSPNEIIKEYNPENSNLKNNRIKTVDEIINTAEVNDGKEIVQTAENVMNRATTLLGIVAISITVWIVCIISLILNCVKKNAGKAVFAGIGLIIPIISIALISAAGIIDSAESDLRNIFIIIAFALDFIFLVFSFIFCFSKNKRTENNIK